MRLILLTALTLAAAAHTTTAFSHSDVGQSSANARPAPTHIILAQAAGGPVEGVAKGTVETGKGVVKGTAKVGKGVVEGTSEVGKGISRGPGHAAAGVVKGTVKVGEGVVEGAGEVGKGLLKGGGCIVTLGRSC